MPKSMSSSEQFAQLNPKHEQQLSPVYHPPKGRFKLIYQGLVLPDLPAPFHFLSITSLIGQPKIPLFYNPALIREKTLNTASVLACISPHQTKYLKSYSIREQCHFQDDLYQFDQIDQIEGNYPQIKIQRHDAELELNLNITMAPKVTYFVPLKWSLFEYWSVLCQCEGTVHYQNHCYEISGMGSFNYARAANIPYLPLAFYTHQILNLGEHIQVILTQARNQWNQVVYSRFYWRTITGQTQTIHDDVSFYVNRVFPKLVTPTGRSMYLPREFSWCVESKGQLVFELKAQSRGDFKFGLGAGYLGSFRYQAHLNGKDFEGEGGYCEYIDLRPLNWQEIDQTQIIMDKFSQIQPCLLKK